MRGLTLGDILNSMETSRPRPPDAKRKKRVGRPKSNLPKNGKTERPGKLSDAEVIEVRQLHAYGLTYGEIRSKFDDREHRPSLSALKHICRGVRRAKVK